MKELHRSDEVQQRGESSTELCCFPLGLEATEFFYSHSKLGAWGRSLGCACFSEPNVEGMRDRDMALEGGGQGGGWRIGELSGGDVSYMF